MYALHGVPIRFETTDERIDARWRRQWAPFIAPAAEPTPPLRVRLAAVPQAPPPPDFPTVSAGPVVVYHRQGNHLAAYFQRWGRYDIDLAAGTVEGAMTEACLSVYGVFEDMIIIALAPLLRRRGLYTLHAFAAARQGRSAILVGDIGAGKTTTGLSLLAAGYKLCANDSPLLRFDGDDPQICAYPGLLSAYPDSVSWFPQLAPVLAQAEKLDESAKLSFAADDIWPDIWQPTATPSLLLFPRIMPGLAASELRPLRPFTALQRLVGQSLENWDAETMAAHLHALRRLTDLAPAFELHLAPDLDRIPALITERIGA